MSGKNQRFTPILRKFFEPGTNDRKFILFASVFLYLSLSLIYNFVQFSSLGIPGVLIAEIVFVGLVAVLIAAIPGRFRNFSLVVESKLSLVWVGVISGFLWLSSFPPAARFKEYFPQFPLHSIDAGGPIGKDTLFNESLVHSILNFGFPSTGLHDAPLVPYHVLSHYVDSAILFVSGLNPLDSAGFLFRLKLMLLAVSFLVLLLTITAQRSFRFSLVTLLLVTPMLITEWLIVWSFPLWATTFILIATAPYCYRAVVSKEPVRSKTLLAIGLIGVAVSLGKISSGIIFILVVGMFLAFHHLKNVKIYVLAGSWLVLLAAYSWLVSSDRAASIAGEAVSLGGRLHGTLSLYLLQGEFASFVRNLYLLGMILAVFYWFMRKKSTLSLLTAWVAGMMLVGVLRFIGMYSHDIRYFEHALFFIVALFGVVNVVSEFPHTIGTFALSRKNRKNWLAVAFGGALIVGFVLMGHSPLDALSKRGGAFSLPSPQTPAPVTNGPGLVEFRRALDNYMATHRLSTSDTLLFIPREVWPDLSSRLSSSKSLGEKDSWAHPLAIYASTGVPLIHGVVSETDYYGFSTYGSAAAIKSRSEAEKATFCEFDKSVVIVEKWSPARFSLVCSEKND